MLSSTRSRLARESGAFLLTGVPYLLMHPVIVRVTRRLFLLRRTSAKKGSSCRHMPDKYELTEFGLI